jgi:anti-sigma regulatory factor (Ser/Thr protein kinase)
MAQASKLATQKLDSISFDTLLSQENPFDGPTDSFDLTGIRLITPSALVELAAACFALARLGRSPVIIVDDSNVRAYLLRSNFVRTIQPVARFRPDLRESMPRMQASSRPSTPLLIEVTKIESGVELHQLLDQVVSVLCNKLGYREPDAFDIATAVSEVSQNTFEHNRDTCGFFAMQVYGTGAGRFLEIGIADFGDGLAATLNRNHKNRWIYSDRAAIERAMKLRVSEFDDPTHGTGLFHLLKIAHKHGGMVQVRSGAAKMRFRTDVPRNWSLKVPHMPGVQVALTLSAKESGNR